MLSPDSRSDTKAEVQEHGGRWEIVIPELKTYDLVAIYLNRKVEPSYGIR